MVRLYRPALMATLVLAVAPALFAAWMSARGVGNTGATPGTPFPSMPTAVWTASLGADYVGKQPSNTLCTESAVIVAFGHTLVAVSADTGAVLWTRDMESDLVGDLLLLDDQIIATLADVGVCAYSPIDGVELWRRPLFGQPVNTPTITDTALALVTKADSFEVIERKTGKSQASIMLEADIVASPVLQGKGILLVFKQGQMVLLENGHNRWNYKLPNAAVDTNAVANGTTILVTSGDTVYSLNTSSITTPIRWSATTPKLVPDGPTLDGDRVYLATTSGQIRALDRATGRDQWGAKGISLPAPAIAAPLVIGDSLYLRLEGGLMVTLAKSTGALLWSYRLPASGSSLVVRTGAPAVEGPSLFFAASDGTIHHLSADMPDQEPPTFRSVLPTMVGVDFSPSRPLQFVGAIVEDEGSGLLPDSVTLHLDRRDLTAKLRFDAMTGYSYAPVDAADSIKPGMHTLEMTAKDAHGNQGVLTAHFFVGYATTRERVRIVINGTFTPEQLQVRPGTIVEFVNAAGSPRAVVADNNAFTSDTLFPTGIPAEGRWAWVVPADAQPGTIYCYHARTYGEAGDGRTPGPGLAGAITVVDARRDLPGHPRPDAAFFPPFPLAPFAR